MDFEWKTDVDPDNKKIPMENIEFVLNEAKAQLAASIRTYDILITKGNTLLAGVVSLSIGLSAYLVKNDAPHSILVVFLVYLVCSTIAAYKALWILWSHTIYSDGYWPHLLFQNEYMQKTPSSLKSGVIQRYAERIALNKDTNEKCTEALRFAITIYLVGAAIFIVGYLAASFGDGLWGRVAAAICT